MIHSCEKLSDGQIRKAISLSWQCPDCRCQLESIPAKLMHPSHMDNDLARRCPECGIMFYCGEEKGKLYLPDTNPILFKERLVMSILEDRKTQTRRILRKWREYNFKSIDEKGFGISVFRNEKTGKWVVEDDDGKIIKSPYGGPGDLLYVRENWRIDLIQRSQLDDGLTFGIRYKADNYRTGDLRETTPERSMRYLKQSMKDIEKKFGGIVGSMESIKFPITPVVRWRPSIHQPQSFTRIFLKVFNVRLERLSMINAYDAIQEGIKKVKLDGDTVYETVDPETRFIVHKYSPIKAFMGLWDSVNELRDTSESDPLVWVVFFDVEI